MYKTSSLIVITAVIILFAVCIGPAAAYTNYEFIWTSSGNQLIQEGWLETGVITWGPNHLANSYNFGLKSGTWATLITPFVNSININGVNPKVRYLYFPLKMPVGVNAKSIQVYNGQTLVCSQNDINWQGTGAYKEYTLDMGSYKNMNRGINTELVIQNTLGTDQKLYTYGAGAKLEW